MVEKVRNLVLRDRIISYYSNQKDRITINYYDKNNKKQYQDEILYDKKSLLDRLIDICNKLY